MPFRKTFQVEMNALQSAIAFNEHLRICQFNMLDYFMHYLNVGKINIT